PATAEMRELTEGDLGKVVVREAAGEVVLESHPEEAIGQGQHEDDHEHDLEAPAGSGAERPEAGVTQDENGAQEGDPDVPAQPVGSRRAERARRLLSPPGGEHEESPDEAPHAKQAEPEAGGTAAGSHVVR